MMPSSSSLMVQSMDMNRKNLDGFYVGFREVSESSLQSSITQSSSLSSSSRLASSYTFKTVELGEKPVDFMKNDFSATIDDLKRNTRYSIIVQAFNKKGSGPSSEEVIAQTAEFGIQLSLSSSFVHLLSLTFTISFTICLF